MLATGLMTGARDRGRGLKQTGRAALAGLLVTAVVAAGGVGVTNYVLAQGGASPDQLVDRLVAIENELPTPLPPDEVIISEDETWAEFLGDFTGTKIALDGVVDEARQLFIEADDASGDVADAVATVARNWVLMQNAFTYLEAWRSEDLTFPLDTFDETNTATGADSGLAYAEIGFMIQIEAHQAMYPAYDVLRRAEDADASERALFDGRYETVEGHISLLIPQLRRALSEETRQVIVTLDRFETTAPGVEARARVMTMTCIDRDAYLAIRGAGPELQEQVTALLSDQLVTPFCPDLQNGNEVRPLGRP